MLRSDFFPGLGWMLTKTMWDELGPKCEQRDALSAMLSLRFEMVTWFSVTISTSHIMLIPFAGIVRAGQLLGRLAAWS